MLNALFAQIEKVQLGNVSFDEFELWFEQNCNTMFAESPEVYACAWTSSMRCRTFGSTIAPLTNWKHDLAISIRSFEQVKV